MTTVINTPSNGDGSDGAIGMIVGIILVVVVVILFFVYGLPAIRNSDSTPKTDNIDIKVNLPSTTETGTTQPAQ